MASSVCFGVGLGTPCLVMEVASRFQSRHHCGFSWHVQTSHLCGLSDPGVAAPTLPGATEHSLLSSTVHPQLVRPESSRCECRWAVYSRGQAVGKPGAHTAGRQDSRLAPVGLDVAASVVLAFLSLGFSLLPQAQSSCLSDLHNACLPPALPLVLWPEPPSSLLFPPLLPSLSTRLPAGVASSLGSGGQVALPCSLSFLFPFPSCS